MPGSSTLVHFGQPAFTICGYSRLRVAKEDDWPRSPACSMVRDGRAENYWGWLKAIKVVTSALQWRAANWMAAAWARFGLT